MSRCKQWARAAGPVPWQDIHEAATRMGVKAAPKPRGFLREESRRNRPDRARSESPVARGRAFTEPKQRAQSKERAQYKTPDAPTRRRPHRPLDPRLPTITGSDTADSPTAPPEDDDHLTRRSISDGEIWPERRPRPPTSTESFNHDRPALSTAGWNDGEPSVGNSDEQDRFHGLGKRQLSSGTLRTALKTLHQKITGKPSLNHAFYDFDQNNDNKISIDEFLEGCSNMKTDLTKEQLSEVFKAMDVNADGFVSREEFGRAFEARQAKSQHPTADEMMERARQKKELQKQKDAQQRGLLVKQPIKKMDFTHTKETFVPTSTDKTPTYHQQLLDNHNRSRRG